jgi:hypothetical protein
MLCRAFAFREQIQISSFAGLASSDLMSAIVLKSGVIQLREIFGIISAHCDMRCNYTSKGYTTTMAHGNRLSLASA